jgi:hypothetical protein
VMLSCVCGPKAMFDSAPTDRSRRSVTVMAHVTIDAYLSKKVKRVRRE